MIVDSQIVDNNVLLNMINSHINNHVASSFIRKGDGENIVIGYKKIEKIKYRDFKRMMRIMNVRLINYKFQNYIQKSLIQSFNNCDMLGISCEKQRYGYWAIEEEVLKLLNVNSNKFCDMNFHMEFVKSPKKNLLDNSLAKKIISNKVVGVISCFDVSSFLAKHNTIIKKWIEMPIQKDRIINKKLNIQFYKNVFSSINENQVDFWIIAAGIHAKIFCNQIKLNGGIAVDIGSAIDSWKNIYSSRGYLRERLDNSI